MSALPPLQNQPRSSSQMLSHLRAWSLRWASCPLMASSQAFANFAGVMALKSFSSICFESHLQYYATLISQGCRLPRKLPRYVFSQCDGKLRLASQLAWVSNRHSPYMNMCPTTENYFKSRDWKLTLQQCSGQQGSDWHNSQESAYGLTS